MDARTQHPHHSEMLKYVRSYADKHMIIEKIKFKTQVLNIEGFRFSIKYRNKQKELNF